jgi:uncharacterized protein YggU (UPF0235/DUF167 family)
MNLMNMKELVLMNIDNTIEEIESDPSAELIIVSARFGQNNNHVNVSGESSRKAIQSLQYARNIVSSYIVRPPYEGEAFSLSIIRDMKIIFHLDTENIDFEEEER